MFKKQKRFISAMGGSLVLVTKAEYWELTQFDSTFDDAPFTEGCGINWEKKILYVERPQNWGTIIHEASHLFVDTWYKTGWRDIPEYWDEFTWFGWEYTAALWLNEYDSWLEGTKNYSFGSEGDVRFLLDKEPDRLREIFDERFQAAYDLGLVKKTTDGNFGYKPIALR